MTDLQRVFVHWFVEVKLAYCKEAVGPSECKKKLHKDSWSSVKEAGSIMNTWRKLVTALPNGQELLAIPEVQTCMSYGDMSMAAYTLNVTLPGEDVKKYKTCQSLAHDLVLILEGILNQELKSPWSAHQLTDSQGSSQSNDVGAQRPAIMRELSSDGSVKDSALCCRAACSPKGRSGDGHVDGHGTWSCKVEAAIGIHSAGVDR